MKKYERKKNIPSKAKRKRDKFSSMRKFIQKELGYSRISSNIGKY